MVRQAQQNPTADLKLIAAKTTDDAKAIENTELPGTKYTRTKTGRIQIVPFNLI